MSIADLKILGFRAPLGQFELYHDDGYVACIAEHLRRLNNHYGVQNHEKDLKKAKNSLGIAVERSQLYWKHHHIFYLFLGPIEDDVAIRAHEETHILDDTGNLGLLSDRLLDEQRVAVNFSNISDAEVRAELGAIYALIAKGLNPHRISSDLVTQPHDIAKRVYSLSRLPERKIFT